MNVIVYRVNQLYTGRMSGRALLVAAFMVCSAPAWSQYATVFADVVDAPSVTHAQAGWLILSVAGAVGPGTSVDDAARLVPEAAARAGRSDEGPVTAAALARMLVSIEEVAPGFWYAIAPGRLTAFALVRSYGLVPRGWRPGTVPTGGEAVDVVRGYFEFARAGGSAR